MRKTRRAAFTLIELSLALAAGAVILVAIYGVFSRTVHLRDSATERTRAVRVEAHAVSVLRNDLRQAHFSGGTLASTLIGSAQNPAGSFPGYLKFTTTTARDTAGEYLASPDLQAVEYYVTTDPSSKDSRAGMLVRTVDGNLLAPVHETPEEQPLLTGIESMEVAFYDGSDWQESWEATEDDPTLPQAVRVRLQPIAPAPNEPKPPLIEILVPWTQQATMGAAAGAATEGGTPP